eukprot:gene10368-21631_t
MRYLAIKLDQYSKPPCVVINHSAFWSLRSRCDLTIFSLARPSYPVHLYRQDISWSFNGFNEPLSIAKNASHLPTTTNLTGYLKNRVSEFHGRRPRYRLEVHSLSIMRFNTKFLPYAFSKYTKSLLAVITSFFKSRFVKVFESTTVKGIAKEQQFFEPQNCIKKKIMGDTSNALSIHWTFGFSKNLVCGVHSLSASDRNAIFYLSSHSGVVYDFEHRTQMILQGHCNSICCCAVSKDKRWIVTADTGDDSILVVWDSMSGAPVKTLFNPHKKGIISLDISDDALYICALGTPDSSTRQEVAIWAWTREIDQPLLRKSILSEELQYLVRFDPQKQSEFSTTGPKTVCFWNWEEFHLEGYTGKVSKTDFGHYSGKFTSTLYLSGTETALTSTDEGFVVVWETQYATVLLDDPADRLMRTASKVIRLVECGISMMSVINGYVVVGCADGTVRFYDYSLRLEAWFEDMAAGPVTSVSFAIQSCPYAPGEGGSPGLQFWVPDFIVGTSDAFIKWRARYRRGTLLVQGMSDDVSALSSHPSRPLLAVACYNGSLQVWDYEMKLLMNLREFSPRSNNSFGNTKSTDHGKRTGAGTGSVATESGLLRPQCLAFDPSGELLAVGFTSGHVKLLRTDNFEDASSFAPTPDTVVGLRFSPSAVYLAAYDSSHHVLIFKRHFSPQTDDSKSEYSGAGSLPNMGGGGGGRNARSTGGGDPEDGTFVYLGRAKAHKAPITGIEFGVREGREILLSIGEDRRCVEFNLQQCSIQQGLVALDLPVRVELTAHPTAILWHPHIGNDVEDRSVGRFVSDRFIIANDEFKFKEFNADSKQCRKTTLAPTFGGPPNRLLVVPDNSGVETQTQTKRMHGHFVYSTAERVVGIGTLPLTGNPGKVMGLVAHPTRISGISLSYDGSFLFTSGGSDLTTNMWAMDTEALYRSSEIQSSSSSVEPLPPFLDLLEGGSEGDLHRDIVDYFYYCQLRSQGEDSMEPRHISGRVPLEELSSLMRAVGFYPTEEEISNMINEVRYKYFMLTGETQSDINLVRARLDVVYLFAKEIMTIDVHLQDDFIKLYINHRPAVPLSNVHIEAAFAEIRHSLQLAAGGHKKDKEIEVGWSDLKRLLTTEGEVLSAADLELCLSALLGVESSRNLEGTSISANKFADQILGFEDFNEASDF